MVAVAQNTKSTSLFHALAAAKKPHDPFAQYYPPNWPYNPFHEGEVAIQKQEGVHDSVMSYAPRFVRPYMPQQHAHFYQAQPFLVAAASDEEDQMWATLLTSPTGMADLTTSPDPATLEIAWEPVAQDALAGALKEGTDLGLLGIEFATKRRNRVNGRITNVSQPDSSDDTPVLTFSVDQSFGNCPQYLVPRKWWTAEKNETTSKDCSTTPEQQCRANRPKELNAQQMTHISQARTILTATGYRAEGEHMPYFGNDASHRGGPAGFVRVLDSKTLLLPEFAGNNHFNTLGNLKMDNRMGITIPSFEDGGMLQLTGRTSVDMNHDRAANACPGALRVITFHIKQVNEVQAGSLPVRWSPEEDAQTRQVMVSSIVQESNNVKSFHLQPLPQDKNRALWDFQAGQHLPIQLFTPRGELLRTYSLSSSPGDYGEYRISVKREPFGQASTFLHDHVKVGDIINVAKPAGDFTLPKVDTDSSHDRPLILLSNGIGVTPILSMLHQYLDNPKSARRRSVFWVHGARNSNHHPFNGEVQGLVEESQGSVKSHVAYSKPLPGDKEYDSEGRVNVNLLQKLASDLTNADVFMCGNVSFMAEVQHDLEQVGVDPERIFYETF
eukprot:CAMPEP_0168783922 /NCGR_PEP_ID=MMETSP0725-20121227/9948_1 /TAXON_ID=265536 /ORGANISM="Amphiprora sp., Strain CCMP467" /LENGTH=610 /DNA_ID=CAMNT_0008833939 /DNA_START=38 /DNA_END=1870 /DNA_ORIENTATION=-